MDDINLSGPDEPNEQSDPSAASPPPPPPPSLPSADQLAGEPAGEPIYGAPPLGQQGVPPAGVPGAGQPYPMPVTPGSSGVPTFLVILLVGLFICICVIPIVIIVILALLGSAIGNIFSNIIEELEATPEGYYYMVRSIITGIQAYWPF
ncbi:MAG: hypothetical protein GYB65_16965 [Chloroflexi bacterium]|nr:hypothetical protein [Chloroflexota bacterium]